MDGQEILRVALCVDGQSGDLCRWSCRLTEDSLRHFPGMTLQVLPIFRDQKCPGLMQIHRIYDTKHQNWRSSRVLPKCWYFHKLLEEATKLPRLLACKTAGLRHSQSLLLLVSTGGALAALLCWFAFSLQHVSFCQLVCVNMLVNERCYTFVLHFRKRQGQFWGFGNSS